MINDFKVQTTNFLVSLHKLSVKQLVYLPFNSGIHFQLLTLAKLFLEVELMCIGADFRFEVPGQSSVVLIGGGRGQWVGAPWRVRSTSL